MQIGIIGAGALGLLCSSYLSKNHTVTLYVRRQAQRNSINNEQISLSINGEEKFTTTNVATKLISDITHEDCIIIAVKQTKIQEVMQQLNKINQKIPLIFLQNGMGHLEALQATHHPAYIGIVQHGAVKKSDVSVNHLGVGNIKLAAMSGTKAEVHAIQSNLHTRDFPFKLEDDWERVLKRKLIINAVINPLTALFDVKNREIIDNQHIRNIGENLCLEASRVLELDSDKAWKSVEEVARNTGENTSSMRADVKQGNKTEIEAISGYILKRSKQPVLYTEFVYEAILAIEQQSLRSL